MKNQCEIFYKSISEQKSDIEQCEAILNEIDGDQKLSSEIYQQEMKEM